MKSSISAFAALGAALVFACGAEAPDSGTDAASPRYDVVTFNFDGPTTSRPATPEESARLDAAQEANGVSGSGVNPDPIGDYGQTSEALSIPQGEYGQQKVTTGPCFSPNSQADYCGVPLDKIIKYHWAGPTTDSNYPSLNFKTILQDAVAELASKNTSFTWQNGSSSSGEGMALAPSGGNLGVTSVFFNLPAKQVSPGFWVAKQNGCDTRIDLNVTIAFGWNLETPAIQNLRFRRLFEHEMMHCAGFPDFYDAGHQGVFLSYGTMPPFTPLTISTLEAQILTLYKP